MLVDKLFQIIPFSLRNKLRALTEKIRRKAMLDFYSQFVTKGSVVFDIGANVGDYSLIFLELGANVICVEPQPYCINELKHRFMNNPKVKIVEKGVADKNGIMSLSTDRKNPATASFSEKYRRQGPFNNRTWDRSIEVQVTTLDDLINEFGAPDFCKIDVEGFEEAVLKGLHSIIPAISFEYCLDLIDETELCLDSLFCLGNPVLNFSVAYTTTNLQLKEWTPDKNILLSSIKNTPFNFSGDIFVKFTNR